MRTGCKANDTKCSRFALVSCVYKNLNEISPNSGWILNRRSKKKSKLKEKNRMQGIMMKEKVVGAEAKWCALMNAIELWPCHISCVCVWMQLWLGCLTVKQKPTPAFLHKQFQSELHISNDAQYKNSNKNSQMNEPIEAREAATAAVVST